MAIDRYEDGVVRSHSDFSGRGEEIFRRNFDENGKTSSTVEWTMENDVQTGERAEVFFNTDTGYRTSLDFYENDGGRLHYDCDSIGNAVTGETFNSNGQREHRIEWDTDSDGNRTGDARTEKTYDAQSGRLVRTDSFDDHNQVSSHVGYHENGVVREEIMYNVDRPDPDRDNVLERKEYDEKGRLLSEVHFDPADGAEEISSVAYSV